MLVCNRCGKIGIEDSTTLERQQDGSWKPTDKTFSHPRGGICDQCLDEIAALLEAYRQDKPAD